VGNTRNAKPESRATRPPSMRAKRGLTARRLLERTAGQSRSHRLHATVECRERSGEPRQSPRLAQHPVGGRHPPPSSSRRLR
jgi:hypothetical protein